MVFFRKTILAGFLAGIAVLLVSQVTNFFSMAVFPYDLFSLGGIRGKTDPIMLLFFLHYFVLSFAMAIVYEKTRQSFEGNFAIKGLKFGLMVWLVSGLFSGFVVFTSMNYPIGFTMQNVIGSLLYTVAGAIVIAKVSE